MKYYEDFRISSDTFEERIGEPEKFDAALGRIVSGFSFLEDTARNVVCMLLSRDARIGKIVCAELGFRQKLDVLASLVWHRLASENVLDAIRQSELVRGAAPRVDDVDAAGARERFNEILHLCRRAEELRNQYLHSSYSFTARSKMTAKARRGLQITTEPTNPDIVLDVADFIVSTAMILEEVPIYLGSADSWRGAGHRLSYLKDDAIVAEFDFGE